MNQGKICVSVCAKTADELIQQIKRAEEMADVIEIRFDCLDESELSKFLLKLRTLKIPNSVLATFRPIAQGGKRELELRTRIAFWRETVKDKIYDFIDFECDLAELKSLKIELLKIKSLPVLGSLHDFDKTPNNLVESYKQLAVNSEIIKIAVQANDITDTIPIWKLLNLAKSENKEIIPIAMSEAGKWTRILGLAHGAFMTYASLDSDKETAPGQVTAQDLIQVYRAKELNQETEVYGILGSKTSVSLSPLIHNTAFKFHQLNAVFVPLQVQNLDEFISRMVKPETREIDLNFKGFSVTIPHKQNIIKHLDYLDATAEKIGAVNTVKIIDGKLHGYNTDAQGFIEPLKKYYGDLNGARVALLGGGGAALACLYALRQHEAEVTIFAGVEVRSSEFRVRSFDEFDIIVNATPLGMQGTAEGKTPLTAKQIKGAKLIYDLVYIPIETECLKIAKSVGVSTIGGLEMLLAQAVEQQRIWTGLDAPIKEIQQIVLAKIR